ncbi:uncharacterized protein LOC125229079 [Leguminivora glycinivorella]|uniref:uncharacterized protein LOC125229079 n=1 Tax=Leguminivora glycinivorella TaxID=1035111 RepID=UPI00200EADF4|nr:uncharacterized protein LOC125229079 [Leguminivora glycinivorella]
MNSVNFNKWLRQKLVPNLHEPISVVVLDNASYHTVQINKPPNRQSRKADLQNWLIEKSIPFDERCTKEQLLCLVGQHKEEPVYEADEILRTHGHEVLRLPPYHCFLNPIELIWSIAKRKVASKNVAQSAQELEKTIKECFESVTPNDWKKMTDHVLHIENQYMQKENITAQMKRFVISVCDEESSSILDSDEVGSQTEYLLSDFDDNSN